MKNINRIQRKRKSQKAETPVKTGQCQDHPLQSPAISGMSALSPNQVKALLAIAEWEREGLDEYCAAAVLARMHASVDDMASFAADDRQPGEQEHAKKYLEFAASHLGRKPRVNAGGNGPSACPLFTVYISEAVQSGLLKYAASNMQALKNPEREIGRIAHYVLKFAMLRLRVIQEATNYFVRYASAEGFAPDDYQDILESMVKAAI